MSERKPLIQSDRKPLIQLQPRGRMHPDLVRLDGLALTFPGWEKDKSEAEEAHFKYPFLFDGILDRFRRKQNMHDGNRRHPQLIRLDVLSNTLSYPDWQKDNEDAQNLHIKYPNLFDDKIKYMEKRQKIHEGDRSAPQLKLLDALNLTYPNCQQDLVDAERTYLLYPNLFDGKVDEMRKQERIHQHDRSDNNLRRLDALNLSYPGWQQAKADAERTHWHYLSLFDGKLEELRKRERMHKGDRSDDNLRRLDAVKLSYPGWQQDKADAEETHVLYPTLFDGKLEELRKKQALHSGERSNCNLVQLDGLELTYPGWQRDKAEAEKTFVQYPILFDGKLIEMRKKEKIHLGNRTAPELKSSMP